MHRTRPVHTGLKRREVRKTHRAPDAEHRTVRCSSDLNPGSTAKRTSHLTRTTGRTSLRPVPVVRCLTLAGPGTDYTGRTDSASGASVASVRSLLRVLQMSHRRNRKYTLHFRKLGGRESGTHPLSTLQTPPPSQSVPTPQCVNQQVHVC